MFAAITFWLLSWAASASIQAVPPPIQVEGWTRTGPANRFTPGDLFGHIDGGAEIFLELGFSDLTVQQFRRGEDVIEVEIYRMADPAAALGIYLMKCGTPKPNPDFKERHTLGRYQLVFQRHRYYGIIQNLKGKPELTGEMLRFGKAVTSTLPADVRPAELDLLPRESRVEDSTRVVRGYFGLNALFTLGDGDLLQLSGKVTAVSARYQDRGAGEFTRLIAPYPSRQDAARAFAHLAGHLDPHLEVIDSDQSRIVFQDYSRRFGIVTLNDRRVDLKIGLRSNPLANEKQ
jgi:hypothetical protein